MWSWNIITEIKLVNIISPRSSNYVHAIEEFDKMYLFTWYKIQQKCMDSSNREISARILMEISLHLSSYCGIENLDFNEILRMGVGMYFLQCHRVIKLAYLVKPQKKLLDI